MTAWQRKILVHLTLFYLAIATVDAKALTKREVSGTNYFENLLNRLDKLKNIPIVGDALQPYISRIYSTAERFDKWSDGSLSRLVNSVFPCKLSSATLVCSGTLDRESLHTLIKKILRSLPVNDSMIPMLDFATDVMI